MPCDQHTDHSHVHRPNCGHASVTHGNHVDYSRSDAVDAER